MSLLRASARRPEPEPLELDETLVVAGGTGLWLLALLGLGAADLVGVAVPGWWLAMCACGVLLGLVGLRVLARRKAALRSGRH